MALASGTKLGPYEIIALARGAGGAGEVYRARDTRLNRDVAITVLPPASPRDPDYLRRFKREARVAAALNHPNILAIYDIGEIEGSPYFVTDFLEGETLRDRLSSGAMPVRKAIESAEQIAHALAMAHNAGIVHRDLKPENIFITRNGRVMVLDFGLAKLTSLGGGVPIEATLASLSETGVVPGTIAYMSPEQVSGKVPDHRSDLFSFGAILYEMLSGKRAFRGETPLETVSAILKENPPDLTATSRGVPPALERIVRHCLEKDPEERFQSAQDVAVALENLSRSSGTDAAAELPKHGGLSRRDFDQVLDALRTWASTHPRKHEPIIMLMGRTLTPEQFVTEVDEETEFGASFLDYVRRQSENPEHPTRPRTFIDREIMANGHK